MFKPFSPKSLKKVDADHQAMSIAENDHATPIYDGDDWQRWSLDSLKAKLAQASSPQASESKHEGRFVRDAELAALKEQARQEAWEQGHAEGYKAGHEAGYSDGAREAKAAVEAEKEAKIAAAVEPLQQLAQQFSQALALADTEVADQLVELAITVGTELARQNVAENPEHIVELVRELLHDESPFNDKAMLILHPDDHALVQVHLHDDLKQHGWKMMVDERITPGGCKVSSKLGERDATWESRVQAIQEQMRKREVDSK
ncbi:MAG: flagellar assembly protein FliH [Aliidiomarina sp.]|uniref:flagellar assembly protein FliH n=1 Tax=Aliidiomarina sp. TaxID=1872439 RepID=UPI0025C4E449|nr:flagellar assembly protein FliH [Aliidiomarina sp.]MCH8501050.1 flagellar assembly protein FliH [Aliidiomarina sp.]